MAPRLVAYIGLTPTAKHGHIIGPCSFSLICIFEQGNKPSNQANKPYDQKKESTNAEIVQRSQSLLIK
jgi:hypothetical protein